MMERIIFSFKGIKCIIKLDEEKYKNYFAHTHNKKESETLIAHSLLTQEYLDKNTSREKF